MLKFLWKVRKALCTASVLLTAGVTGLPVSDGISAVTDFLIVPVAVWLFFLYIVSLSAPAPARG